MEIRNIAFLFTLDGCYKRSAQQKNILEKSKYTIIVRLLHHIIDYLISKVQRINSIFFSCCVNDSVLMIPQPENIFNVAFQT